MTQKILGFAGRVNSGKDTLANFIIEKWYEDRDKIKPIDHYDFNVAKKYAFADELKSICQKLFGLTKQQCYGTNDDKSTLTKVKWEHLPHYEEWIGRGTPQGFMTAREVLQQFGTNICRRMNNNCWADACLKNIMEEGYQLAVVSDVRFINEVETIQSAGGKVIKLSRNPYNQDHISETQLDNYDKFDATLFNHEMDLKQQNRGLLDILGVWKWL